MIWDHPKDAENVTVTFGYNGDTSLDALADRGSCDVSGNTKTCSLGSITTGTRAKLMITQSQLEDAVLTISLDAIADPTPRNNFLSLYLGGLSNLDSDNDGVTNNLDEDDDGDGIADSQEAVYGTNSLLTDTDGDGFSDDEEITEQTDPLDANSAPMSGLSLILIKAFLDRQEAAQQAISE